MTELQSKLKIKNYNEYCELLMQKITESLLNLGCKPKFNGFLYVKEAIYLYANTRIVNSICKDIYTQIAHKYSVTTTSIDRAIRKVIEDSWYDAELNVSHDLFKCSYIKLDYLPTNLEFIATMAEIIKITIRKPQVYSNPHKYPDT